MAQPDSSSTLVSPDEAVKIAVAWQREGRLAEAAILYDRVLATEPTHPEALHFLGLLKHQIGAVEQGLGYLRQAVEAAPSYAEAHCNLGNMLYEQRDLVGAEAAYHRALELNPGLTDALNNLGMLAKQQGRLESAEQLYRRAINESPEAPLAYNNLGHLLTELGRYDDAENLLSRAIALAPSFAAAHRNLADLHQAQGRLAEATRHYKQAVEHGADSYLELATALRDQGLVDEAIAAYRKVVEIGGRQASVFHSLGSLLSARGKNEEAAEVFRQWLAWDPGNAVALHMLRANAPAESSEPLSRAPDAYVEAIFDGFAAHFDSRLQNLDYRAPELVADALAAEDARWPLPAHGRRVLDAGCGTGLCGPLLRSTNSYLEGVDLSQAMLELANNRGCYDRLVKEELTTFLTRHRDQYDVIISADTLVYFGDLGPVLDAASHALRTGGILVFTVERLTDGGSADYLLRGNGRYCHSERYLRNVVTQAGLHVTQIRTVILRLEMAAPVHGYLVSARQPSQDRWTGLAAKLEDG